jgi:hypothetical protein
MKTSFSRDGDARLHLEYPPRLDEGLLMFFNEGSFTVEQAQFLLNLTMPRGKTPQTAFMNYLLACEKP